MTNAVLITGSSSGIGRATAERLLVHPELTVYATARRVETLTGLARAGARTLALDVTDENSMRDAVAAVEAEHGTVTALVNNAGYGEFGTIEEVDLDRARRQFDTNVFGLARMAQLVLPGMRRAGSGRIVNISSMGGRMVFPAAGYYHASKYAVEALTDALRFEAAPFGVAVVLIEPGLIRTRFGPTAAGTLANAARPDGPYTALNAAVNQQMAAYYRSVILSAAPDKAARTVERALMAAKPRNRYLITPAARALVHGRRLLGSRAFDAYLRAQFGTPFHNSDRADHGSGQGMSASRPSEPPQDLSPRG